MVAKLLVFILLSHHTFVLKICDIQELVSIGEGEHGGIGGGAVQVQYRINLEEAGGGGGSLWMVFDSFMDVCDVMIKAQFITQDDAKVLKAPHHLHWLAVDGSGAMRGVYCGCQR